MNRTLSVPSLVLAVSLLLFGSACVTENSKTGSVNTQVASSSPTPVPSVTPATDAHPQPVTLAVIDAFFAGDESFPKDLAKLGITDDQIQKLRAVAHDETAKLRESETGDDERSTASANELASQRLKEILGDDKARQLVSLVSERWQGSNDESTRTASNGAGVQEQKLNAIPTDTRIVINSPAYRMDVFDKGHLVKSYKVAIGYPEFPLPTGMRKAKTIIFNPTWTPPDEPWVESPTSKVKVGEKIEAGSKLNPLGLLKIPIGLPSLIHGGKSPAKLGTFGSHGCVGLTDALVQDFAKELAQLGGTELTDADINEYKKNRSETKQLALKETVPVELRYETIVAEDGKLHIYRDVYDHNTNTEENLRAVLTAAGVSLDHLSETERSQVMAALKEMSRDAQGKLDQGATASPSPAPGKNVKITRAVKGKKEVVIEIAALKGKGYPAMASSQTSGATTKGQGLK